MKTKTALHQLRKTAKGFAGHGGGRWGNVPQPPDWYTTSVQLCGIYPFGAGSARPTDGAPLGRDMIADTAICTDPEALYRAGVISSPSMMVFGINGVGKSSTVQTMALGMVGRGMTLASFDPMKGEHTALTEALGGTVLQVGPNGSRLNILAPGPWDWQQKSLAGRSGKNWPRWPATKRSSKPSSWPASAVEKASLTLKTLCWPLSWPPLRRRLAGR